jgi:ribosome biogenesis GTPase
MLTGLITRALSGTYTVILYPSADQQSGIAIICKPRGIFRKMGITPLVGDRVAVNGDTIFEILPRKNLFERPPVANIDAIVIIACQALPIAAPLVLDTMIALAELKGCEPILALNKCDLDPADELYRTYTAAGVATFRVSAATGAGIAELSAAISDKLCAFAGNTGVGKTSLINALAAVTNQAAAERNSSPATAPPTISGNSAGSLTVGEISLKLKRGRHTTRVTELFELPNGAYVIDTAGFGFVNDDELPAEQLEYLFREFAPYLGKCRFPDCQHLSEPYCQVTAALRRGEIPASRYSSYVKLLQAAKQRRDNQYK